MDMQNELIDWKIDISPTLTSGLLIYKKQNLHSIIYNI